MLSSLAERLLTGAKQLVLTNETQGIWLLTGLAPFTFSEGLYAFNTSEPIFVDIIYSFVHKIQDSTISLRYSSLSTRTYIIHQIIQSYLKGPASEGYAFEAAIGWALCLFDGKCLSELPFLNQELLQPELRDVIFQCNRWMLQNSFENTLKMETGTPGSFWSFLNNPALCGTAFKPEDSMHPDCLLFCSTSNKPYRFISFSIACKALWTQNSDTITERAAESANQTDPQRFYYNNFGKTLHSVLNPPPKEDKEPEKTEV